MYNDHRPAVYIKLSTGEMSKKVNFQFFTQNPSQCVYNDHRPAVYIKDAHRGHRPAVYID